MRLLIECSICGRKAMKNETFCEYHQVALKKLKEGFNEWKEALDVDWQNYLLRLYETEGLGQWIQEMIEYIMSQEST